MDDNNRINKSNNLMLVIAWIMFALGVLISIFFMISTFYDGYFIFGPNKINFTTTGQFGDFLGGVVGTFFTLSGTLLIFLSFRSQSKQNEKQAFEAKFYEMLRLHKQNIEEISICDYKGRTAIEYLLKHKLQELYIEVEQTFSRIKLTVFPNEVGLDHEDSLLKIKEYLNNEYQSKLLAHKLSYGFFFYGIEEYHLSKNKTDIIYEINLTVSHLMKLKLLSVNEGYHMNASDHFNSVLGHYYRHLFQLIKLVANEKTLLENEKYEFTKIIRAQLSDYEQILLYYNSLSVMGQKWITPLNVQEIDKMCFIARFRLIKNIPYYFNYFGIKPATLFKTEIKAWEKVGLNFFETNIDG